MVNHHDPGSIQPFANFIRPREILRRTGLAALFQQASDGFAHLRRNLIRFCPGPKLIGQKAKQRRRSLQRRALPGGGKLMQFGNGFRRVQIITKRLKHSGRSLPGLDIAGEFPPFQQGFPCIGEGFFRPVQGAAIMGGEQRKPQNLPGA